MFKIVNDCRNLKLQFEQMRDDEIPEKSDSLAQMDSMNYAFYDPELDKKLQMTL